MLFSCSKALQG